MHGLFVFEGPDGVGKSTVVREVEKYVLDAGHKCVSLSFPGQERNTLGSHIYKLHHAPEKYGVANISPLSLQLLHVAAHVDAIEQRILPLIRGGTTVLLDRYWWSSWAYGFAGGVSLPELRAMLAIEHLVWRGLVPTALFLLSRSQSMADHRVLDAYKDLAAKESPKYPIVVLKNENTLAELVENVMRVIRKEPA
jgi:dTMP kinase